MKNFFRPLFYSLLCLSITLFTNCKDDDDGGGGSNSNTITFSKANNADPTLEENQDRITENVWITRGNNQGIYNAAVENTYTDFASPADTEWAFGTIDDLENLTFADWESTIDDNSTTDQPPLDMLDRNMVLHLISDDIFLDIKFTAWTVGQGGGGPGGGGFTYERSEIFTTN